MHVGTGKIRVGVELDVRAKRIAQGGPRREELLLDEASAAHERSSCLGPGKHAKDRSRPLCVVTQDN